MSQTSPRTPPQLRHTSVYVYHEDSPQQIDIPCNPYTLPPNPSAVQELFVEHYPQFDISGLHLTRFISPLTSTASYVFASPTVAGIMRGNTDHVEQLEVSGSL